MTRSPVGCSFSVLPLALTDAGWVVVGTVSGALAGSSVDAVLAWHRERRLAKAGARLVAGEISGADSQLEAVEKEGRWWRFHGIPIDNWSEYKNILAIRLSDLEFEAVSQGVMLLENLRQQMPMTPPFRKDPDLPYLDVEPKNIRPVRMDAAKA